MMFQPVDSVQRGITAGQCSFEWCRMLRQGLPLLLDPGAQGTVPGRQLKQARVHSGFLA